MTIGIMPALLGTVEFVTGVFAFELVKPSSVVVTGSGSESATISALGSVEFSAAATLSLNDVFSSGYDNYMVVMWALSGPTTPTTRLRFRSSGSDATGSDYTYQTLFANGTSVTASRATTDHSRISNTTDAGENGITTYIYGPALAQPTATRSVTAGAYSGAYIWDYASTHSLSTAYDGMTLYPSTGSFEGRVAVYGMRG